MKHHYSPCFYTKKWVNVNGKIFYYSIKNNKVLCDDIAPQNTGYEIDLYAKENTTEDDKHSIEIGCYKEIDDKASKIHLKIIESGVDSLTVLEKNDWCRFIVSMMTRHAHIVYDAKIRGIEVIDRQASVLTPVQQNYYEEKINYWRDNVAQETLAAMATPKSKHDIGIFEKYNDTLLKMLWWVEDFSKTSFALLTSDYPVAISPLRKNSSKFTSPNEILSSGDYLLSLPLTPQLCFYARMGENRIINNNAQLIKSQNNLTVLKAKNFVYANDKSQEHFIRKRFQLRIPTKSRK